MVAQYLAFVAQVHICRWRFDPSHFTTGLAGLRGCVSTTALLTPRLQLTFEVQFGEIVPNRPDRSRIIDLGLVLAEQFAHFHRTMSLDDPAHHFFVAAVGSVPLDESFIHRPVAADRASVCYFLVVDVPTLRARDCCR